MLKEIPVNQLRKGMFLSKLCGSWLKHPFWKQAFLLEKNADIQSIVNSGIKSVVIDTSKGLDVEAKQEVKQTPKPNENQSAQTVTPQKTSMSAEWSKAKKICDQAKTAVVQMFQEVRMGNAVKLDDVKPIVEDISSSVIRNPNALINVARLKTIDDYTYMHSVAVCAMMTALARQLGLDEESVAAAAQGGLLHDLGKASIPNQILNKEGKLTDKEFSLVRLHPKQGYDMLVGNDSVTEQALDIALHHHEKFDGTGYPDGLKGEEISLFARMGAVCDVYDALTSDRCYKKGWAPAVAIKRMASWKGHFDPSILQAFIKVLGIYPVGALVRLESERLAVVLEQSEQSLLQPRVKVFFSTKSKAPIETIELDLASKNANDKIISLEEPSNWNFKNLDELWIPSSH